MDNGDLKLGYTFINKGLLRQALTHSSYAYENESPDGERLEFLGDSLLNAIIAAYFFRNYPHLDEGQLTMMRAQVVNRKSLSKIAQKCGIDTCILLGKGEVHTGGSTRDSTLADAVEAVIGAVFLDSDFGTTHDVVLELCADALTRAEVIENYKGRLQELYQKKYRCKPVYRITCEYGSGHRKIFTAEVRCAGAVLGCGSSTRKVDAEQLAAKNALECIDADILYTQDPP